MTTAQISRITPPPSVEAVLGALTEETRIGQVDFSSRLADPADAADADAVENEALAEAEPVDDAIEDVVEDEVEPEVDSAVQVVDEIEEGPDADVVTLVLAAPLPEESAESDEDEAPVAKRSKRRRPRKAEPTEAPVVVPEVELATPVRPEPTDTEIALTHEVDEDDEDHDDEPVAHGRRPLLPEPLDLAALLDSTAGIDERPPSIDEIARLVVERMHDAELAMMRHLEAVEVETARRAELATAQAELDAELIRLNARREAHAIVTAARRRAGQEVEEDPAAHEVERITESLTRFADVLEELRPSPRPGRST